MRLLLVTVSIGLALACSGSAVAEGPEGQAILVKDWQSKSNLLQDDEVPAEFRAETTENEKRDSCQPQPVEIPVTILHGGNSARALQNQAVQEIPWQLLNDAGKEQARSVLSSLGMYRRLPTLELEANHDVYRYFVAHPDVAVSIWRALKISRFKMWQTGPDQYEADAGDGTLGVVDVLYRGADQNLIICDGIYKTPISPQKFRAKALIHLRTKYYRAEDGTEFVRHQADLFVTFPSQTVETIAKLIAPISNVIVDRNFREVSAFVYMMTVAMSRQPGWVEQVTARLEGILEQRKPELLDVTARVYVEAQKQRSGEQAEAVVEPTPDVHIKARPISATQTVPTEPGRISQTSSAEPAN